MTRVAILVSGVLRSFTNKLLQTLEQLPESWHIFISMPTSNKADRFLNDTISIDALSKNPRIKLLISNNNDSDTNRYKNMLIQWYRIYTLFNFISPAEYDIIVRCRPDIKFECSIEHFITKISSTEPNCIYIPTGFDIYDNKLNIDITRCINDQFAYGSYSVMKKYCETYFKIQQESQPISEHILFKQLEEAAVPIIRVDIPYKLSLSKCVTISICGDSGSGKSHLTKLIEELLHFDNTLTFETDRYHKWERGAVEYKTYSHLNPQANNLDKLANDAYQLTLGEDIFMFDYDHDTGKFTQPELIQPKKYLVLCGLHTLFKESLRQISDLKIYMDTDPELKKAWKIARDIIFRKATVESVCAAIQQRQPDYNTYILPQRENADLIINMFDEPACIKLRIGISNTIINDNIYTKLQCFSTDIFNDSAFSYFTFRQPTQEELTVTAHELHYYADLKPAPDGLIQYCILLLIWKP